MTPPVVPIVSARQRRRLRQALAGLKCTTCREKALVLVKGEVICSYCGRRNVVG